MREDGKHRVNEGEDRLLAGLCGKAVRHAGVRQAPGGVVWAQLQPLQQRRQCWACWGCLGGPLLCPVAQDQLFVRCMFGRKRSPL